MANSREERLKAIETMKELAAVPGHPVQILCDENEAIRRRIAAVEACLETNSNLIAAVEALGELRTHYDKKRDLIYPMLDAGYEVTGPSKALWTEDDELRRKLKVMTAGLKRAGSLSQENVAAWQDLLKALEGMTEKEERVLIPLCVQFFSNKNWRDIRADLDSYENALTGPLKPFTPPQGEAYETPDRGDISTDKDFEAMMHEVDLPSGHMSLKHMEAMLQTVPVEMTFVDETDHNRYFSKGNTGFKRSLTALDRVVFSCHAPKSVPMVHKVIDAFRAGEKDSVEYWLEKKGEPLFIKYIAVRDDEGNYLGTLECVQNMAFARDHFRKREN